MGVDFDHVFAYHQPTADQVVSYAELRQKGKELAQLIEKLCPASADRTVAIRKIREALMVANAAIALDGRIDKVERNI